MTWTKRTIRLLTVVAAPIVSMGVMHITPTVVLQKQADVIRNTLPTAQNFFVTTVEIGRRDVTQIKQIANFVPEDAEFKFFYGKDAGGAVDGVVLFPQVNTQHGPFEVGLTIGPNGTILRAVVTKATVETKPWVERVIRAGLMDNFTGMRVNDDPATALRSVSEQELGTMPYYAAEVLTTAVKRGLALYRVLYHP